jgi:hypothetical protein
MTRESNAYWANESADQNGDVGGNWSGAHLAWEVPWERRRYRQWRRSSEFVGGAGLARHAPVGEVRRRGRERDRTQQRRTSIAGGVHDKPRAARKNRDALNRLAASFRKASRRGYISCPMLVINALAKRCKRARRRRSPPNRQCKPGRRVHGAQDVNDRPLRGWTRVIADRAKRGEEKSW